MDTRDGTAVIVGPGIPPLAQRAGGTPVPHRWTAGTRLVLAGAALASALALATWGGVLWRYLEPSAFRGRLLLGPPASLEFILFAGRAVLHAAVVAAVAAGLAGWRGARRTLLIVGVALLALAVYEFTKTTLFPAVARSPTQGADFIVNVTFRGQWYVGMYGPHLLMVLVLTRARPPARVEARLVAADGPAPHAVGGPDNRSVVGPRELGYYVQHGLGARADNTVALLVVLVAVITSATQVAEWSALMWVQFQPSTFRTIGTDWAWYGVALSTTFALLHLGVLAGAAALLARRWELGRRVLLWVAVAVLLLRGGSFMHGMLDPPPDMPRDRGAELVVNTTVDVARVVTMMIVYAVLALAMMRARGNPRGDTPRREGS